MFNQTPTKELPGYRLDSQAKSRFRWHPVLQLIGILFLGGFLGTGAALYFNFKIYLFLTLPCLAVGIIGSLWSQNNILPTCSSCRRKMERKDINVTEPELFFMQKLNYSLKSIDGAMYARKKSGPHKKWLKVVHEFFVCESCKSYFLNLASTQKKVRGTAKRSLRKPRKNCKA